MLCIVDTTQQHPSPSRRAASATQRRPVSDVDAAIAGEINRQLRQRGIRSRKALAAAAGRNEHHAVRLLADQPRQAWTVSELIDYASALGTTAGAVLAGAGLSPDQVSLTDRIMAEPGLHPNDARALIGIASVMVRDHALHVHGDAVVDGPLWRDLPDPDPSEA